MSVAAKSSSEPELTPAEWTCSFARGLIESFRGTVAPDGSYRSRIYQSARSVTEHIASDYSSRFLVELIQNAYDALTNCSSPGRIRLLWSKGEGEHGTLYIANDGEPFQRTNVRALCEVGLSDKPPGQSIGNKGLGFRSVSYVTDEPSIFPGLEPDKPGSYSGHCFRFAGPADLETLLPDPLYLEKAVTDLPRFHVPVPVEQQNEQVRAAAKDGFATCIRAPQESLRMAYPARCIRPDESVVPDPQRPARTRYPVCRILGGMARRDW